MDLHNLITGIQESFEKVVAENRQLKDQISKMSTSEDLQSEYLIQKERMQKTHAKLKQLRTNFQSLVIALEDFLDEVAEQDSASAQQSFSQQPKDLPTEKENQFFTKIESDTNLSDTQKGQRVGEGAEDRDLLEEIVRDIEGY